MPHPEALKDSICRSAEHGGFHKWLNSLNAYSTEKILYMYTYIIYFFSPYLNHQPLSSIHHGNMEAARSSKKSYIPCVCCDINLLKATLNSCNVNLQGAVHATVLFAVSPPSSARLAETLRVKYQWAPWHRSQCSRQWMWHPRYVRRSPRKSTEHTS